MEEQTTSVFPQFWPVYSLDHNFNKAVFLPPPPCLHESETCITYHNLFILKVPIQLSILRALNFSLYKTTPLSPLKKKKIASSSNKSNEIE